MEEYLTTEELCDRIKYQKQTIYNLIHRKVLVAGKHFLKPTPKKILFKWSEISAWIGENGPGPVRSVSESAEQPRIDLPPEDSANRRRLSLIRI